MVCCALALGLAGCGSTGGSSPDGTDSGTVSFTDSAGRVVELPANIERVAVTGPISQMAMLTLAPEKLVGLSNELSAAEIKYVGSEYANLPILGQIYGGKGDFNKEAVANADPQVIIDIGEAKKSIVEDLDAIQDSTGIPCIHIEATYNTYDEAFLQLGEVLGNQDRAKELADYCKKAVKATDDVISTIPESNRVKVLYLLGDAGLNVMGKGSFQGSVVDAIADNVAVLEKVGGSGMGNETSFEQIALWDPEMIIFAPDSIYNKVGDDATWKTLTAISNGNYYVVPGEPYNWISSPPGVNQILGYQWFARLCYPDSFSDSISDIVKDYYKMFYNYDLSDSEVSELIANSAPKK
ncbi:MAG: ABC transporter substrate-binding protein [Coriobacteriales bacterium]|nr:ABC transporter substrate-binding protein [Coriobacteriales bacterium]